MFNDGAYTFLTEKAVKADALLRMEQGKPLLFGKDNKKGIRFNAQTAELEVVTIGENGVTEKDILVHDAKREDPTIAFMLANLAEKPGFPTPIGVFRDVRMPTATRSPGRSSTARRRRSRTRRSRSSSPAPTPGRSASVRGSAVPSRALPLTGGEGLRAFRTCDCSARIPPLHSAPFAFRGGARSIKRRANGSMKSRNRFARKAVRLTWVQAPPCGDVVLTAASLELPVQFRPGRSTRSDQ